MATAACRDVCTMAAHCCASFPGEGTATAFCAGVFPLGRCSPLRRAGGPWHVTASKFYAFEPCTIEGMCATQTSARVLSSALCRSLPPPSPRHLQNPWQLQALSISSRFCCRRVSTFTFSCCRCVFPFSISLCSFLFSLFFFRFSFLSFSFL